MRYRAGVVFVASLMIASAAYIGDEAACPDLHAASGAQQNTEKPRRPPPLVVNKDAPLLLDDPPEEDPLEVPIGPVADNSACFVCHRRLS